MTSRASASAVRSSVQTVAGRNVRPRLQMHAPLAPSRQMRSASLFSRRPRIHQHDDYPFRPPPVSARLRPLIPFFIYWCIITSLAVHLLRARIRSKEELDKAQAQISVLEGLIERYKLGEVVGPYELRRELEMVGLRERVLTKPQEGEGGDVGWMKAIFGRRGVSDDEAKADEDAVEQWAKVVNEVTSHPVTPPAPTSPTSAQPQRIGSARRAPSSTVYM